MPKGTILFSEMTPGPDWEGDFNEWYDTEHIPLRMAAPGFTGAQRYRRGEGLNYLAVYEMASQDALNTEDYRRIKEQPSERTRKMLSSVSGFSRYIGNLIEEHRREGEEEDPLEAAVLYSEFFRAPEEGRSAFEAWHGGECVPALLKDPDWLMCRRFSVTVAEPWEVTHLALHYLRRAEALEGEAFRSAQASEERARLAREPGFEERTLVFGKIGERFRPA